MRDWLTYRLSDFLLFSPRTYYRMVELYHRDMWPAQLVSLAVVAAIVLAAVRLGHNRHRISAAALALAWLWAGVAFHIQRYATINWAATYFGAVFIAQALLIAWLGVVRARRLLNVRSAVAFIATVIASPIVGVLTERTWPQVELFGLTPDATAIATIALLAFGPGSRLLLILPAAWCMIGAATLWALHSTEAWFPLVAAIAALGGLTLRRPKNQLDGRQLGVNASR